MAIPWHIDIASTSDIFIMMISSYLRAALKTSSSRFTAAELTMVLSLVRFGVVSFCDLMAIFNANLHGVIKITLFLIRVTYNYHLTPVFVIVLPVLQR